MRSLLDVNVVITAGRRSFATRVALAVQRGGRFVTFDASIATSAVARFRPPHLVTL